jgi:hypothetical protein
MGFSKKTKKVSISERSKTKGRGLQPLNREIALPRHLVSKTAGRSALLESPIDTIPREECAFNSGGVPLYPLKGKRITKIFKRITFNLALNHPSKEPREAPSLLLGLSTKKLRHDRRRRLTYRTSMSIKSDLGDRITRELKGEGDLVPTERVRKIDLLIWIEQNPLASWTLVMIQDQLLIHVI